MFVEELAARYAEAVRSGTVLRELDHLYAPDAELTEGHWSGDGRPLRGREEIAASLEAREALYALTEMTIEGPWLAGPQGKDAGAFALQLRSVMHLRVPGPGPGPQRITTLSTAQVEGGLIARQWFWLEPAIVPVEPSIRWAARRRAYV